MKLAIDIKTELAYCTGSEHFHFNALHGRNFVYTDGIKKLIELAECYWLLDAIFSYRKKEEFQLWGLEVMADNTAVLTMKEDTGCPNIVAQKIHFTNFPLDGIELYAINDHCCENGEYGNRVVLMLKSEY